MQRLPDVSLRAVLSLIGIAVVGCGLAYHRKQDAIAAWLSANLPPALLRLPMQ